MQDGFFSVDLCFRSKSELSAIGSRKTDLQILRKKNGVFRDRGYHAKWIFFQVFL